MSVLYRKYRPQTFAEMVGQKHIVTTLKNQITSGKLSHAYLFTGGRGVGKTSVARILAKAVNCVKGENSAGDACGECGICKAVEAGNFIDLVEIDAASNTGVDNIREVIEHVRFAPSLGKYKVFIIDEVHMLSKGAFNALLKTLEEPPAHAIFILATTEISKVPVTIISRTQRFDFKSHSIQDIAEYLERVCKEESLNYSPEILKLIAENAQGGMRDAMSLLGKLSSLGAEVSLEDCQSILGVTDLACLENFLDLIASGKAKEIPAFFDGLLENGTDFSVLNKDFLEYLRKLLVFKVTEGKAGFFTEESHKQKLEAFAALLSVNDIMFAIRLFLKSFKDMQGAPSAEIPMLLAAIEAALKKTAAVPAKPASAGTNPPKAPVMKTEIAGGVKTDIVQHMPEPIQIPPSSPQIAAVPFEEVTMAEANGFWPQLVEEIKNINGPLGSLLKASTLSSVENGKLVVCVKYQFDQKTIDKNALTIMQTIKALTGKNMGIIPRIVQEKQEKSPAMSITEALQVFGGEIIE